MFLCSFKFKRAPEMWLYKLRSVQMAPFVTSQEENSACLANCSIGESRERPLSCFVTLETQEMYKITKKRTLR